MDLPPEQVQCIAQAIYSEARSESERGRRAVGHVILNRTRDRRFPNTPCAVVRQRGQFVYRTGTGSLWQNSLRAARTLGADPTSGALYFRARHARGRWPYRLIVTIGNHLFYR